MSIRATLLAAQIVMGADDPIRIDPCDELIVPKNSFIGERFGFALAVEGNLAVVGAPGDEGGGSSSGRVLVFRYAGGAWTYEATLSFGPRVMGAGDRFGFAVDIEDGVIVVGAPLAAPDGNRCGAAFIFTEPPGGWRSTDEPTAVLLPHEGSPGDSFGAGVAIRGSWIFVGAPGVDGTVTDEGLVYVFKRPVDGWRDDTSHVTLSGPPARVQENYGFELASDGDLLVVTGPALSHRFPGVADVYRYDPIRQRWTFSQDLSASTVLKRGDHFGRAAAIRAAEPGQEALICIGSTGSDDHGEHSGSVHVFRSVDGQAPWTLSARLAPDQARRGDHVGFSLCLSGDILLVGAPQTNVFQNNTGVVYEYRYDDAMGAWMHHDSHRPRCPERSELFGMECAVAGLGTQQYALIGAPQHSRRLPKAGAVYVVDVP